MKLWDERALLSDRHDLASFTCGEPAIDGWLERNCARYLKMGLCALWVCPDASGQILGLFTLSSHMIQADTLSRNQQGGVTGVGHPAILLGQVALHSDLRGKGLGTLLLLEALAQCVEFASGIGARFIVLDALNDALVSYYARFGFRSVPNDPRRMIMPMKTARARLDEALSVPL